jgi:hypothetical protein
MENPCFLRKEMFEIFPCYMQGNLQKMLVDPLHMVA